MNGNNRLTVKEGLPVKYPKLETTYDRTGSIISDQNKIELLTKKFEEVLNIIGLDLEDDSLKDTPGRIAKMYINEIFRGLNPQNRPEITFFPNSYGYNSPLMEMNIPFTSFCEHHFIPITGKANLAYIPKDKVIGLSKLHRLVDFQARRPQVQERLTYDIARDLMECLEVEDVGIVLKASHSCISCRGVGDLGTSTITSVFFGMCQENEGLKKQLFGNG